MKKISRWLKTMPLSQKIIFYLVCLIMISLSLVSGTQAWKSQSQQAVNAGQTKAVKQEVHLLKLERDQEGKETEIPISGAKFYLYRVGKNGDQQIGSVYTTNQAGKIPIDLAPGEYYFEEFDPSLGYTYDQDENGKPIKRYPFTVTLASSNKEAIVVAYNRRETGKLAVHKEVKNADGSDMTAAQKSQIFEFEVTFSDSGSYTYRVDGGAPQTLKSGETISLSHGQKAVFSDIPQGVHYRVIERAVPGYQVSADHSSGNIGATLSLVHVVNTYDPQVGQLEVAKTVINGDGTDLTQEQKELDFTFQLTLSDEKLAVEYVTNTGRKGKLHSGETFTLRHDEILTLQNLPVGLTYTINEQSVTGYTASPHVYSGTVRSEAVVRLPFTNQYLTDVDETGRLSFSKKVIATEIDPDQIFTFELTFSDGGTYTYELGDESYRHQSGQKIQLRHGETVVFPALPAGISYELKELDQAGYHPQLTDVNGTILGNHDSTFIFHNYQEEQTQLIIAKVGEGEGFDPEKLFTFRVWINGKELPEPIQLKAGETSIPLELKVGDTWRVEEVNAMDAGYSQSGIINGTGTVTQGNKNVTVTQTNTYIGSVLKSLKGQKHWSLPTGAEVTLPDKIIIHLKDGDTVVATQEVSGPDWKYEFNVPKYNENGEEINYRVEEEPVANFRPNYQDDSLDITNVYVSPVTSRSLMVEKRLTGDTPGERETFEFRLNPGSQMVSTSGAGQASFKPITFTQAGTYTYTISERDKGATGYTYDDSVYVWTVEVVEKDQQLVIASEKLRKNNQDFTGSVVFFDNHFEQDKVIHDTHTIKGQKTWHYGTQAKDKRPTSLTVLLRGNGKVVYQQKVDESSNWQYSFTVNTYDREGKKIAYSIDEEAVPDYEKTVKGFDLINTYRPTREEPGTSTIPDDKTKLPTTIGKVLPQSGEERLLWLSGLGGILVIVGLGLIMVKKRRK